MSEHKQTTSSSLNADIEETLEHVQAIHQPKAEPITVNAPSRLGQAVLGVTKKHSAQNLFRAITQHPWQTVAWAITCILCGTLMCAYSAYLLLFILLIEGSKYSSSPSE